MAVATKYKHNFYFWKWKYEEALGVLEKTIHDNSKLSKENSKLRKELRENGIRLGKN